MNPLVIVPGCAVLLLVCFELPHKIKAYLFMLPTWISSSIISVIVGSLGQGVLGPMTGFATELILFPGLTLAKMHFNWVEKRAESKEFTKSITI